MPAAPFDLVVIGSGPAGQKAALQAAKLGKRVAVVERRGSVGGVCIHTGTIPSKAIREAVLHLTGHGQRDVYGAGYAVKHGVTMADLLAKAHHVMRTEADVTLGQLRRNGVTVVFGQARFGGPSLVRVESHDGIDDSVELLAKHVLVACGTVPARPREVPFTQGRVIDSTELLSLAELPRTMTVVGGGVIGVEYAAMLALAGVRVTLVDGRPRLLEFLDDELGEALQFRLRDAGIRLKLGESVAQVDVDGPRVTATLASQKVITSDCLLYCVGRQGATDLLDLAAAGLEADARGRLKVNEHYQTAVPTVYAAGDVVGFPALAATSMEQGRHAACHMFRQQVADGGATSKPFPYGIYTVPEVSTIGATERELTEAGTPYEVGLARYREVARGLIVGDPHGLLKLVFHRASRRLLGVHALGTGATELVHIGQAVMAAGLPVDYFVETVFNYPTLAEAYKVAALDGLNRLGEEAAGEAEEAPVVQMQLAA